MPDLRHVAYCGLYCELCATGGRIPGEARALRDTMTKEVYEFFGPYIEGFAPFWEFLKGLSRSSARGPVCREGCGNPDCAIRKCAVNRGMDLCVSCKDYPCEHVLALAERYPTLLADGKRLQTVGLEKWIEEQEERAITGFAYADIRHPAR